MPKKTDTPGQLMEKMMGDALKALFANEIVRAAVNLDCAVDIDRIRREIKALPFQEVAGCIDASTKALMLKLTNEAFESQRAMKINPGGLPN